MTGITDLHMPCEECCNARDASWASPREAVLWWQRGALDERAVCRRCYQRLYVSTKSP